MTYPAINKQEELFDIDTVSMFLPSGWVEPGAVSGCEADDVMEEVEGHYRNVLGQISGLCGHRQKAVAQALRCRAEGGCPPVQAQKDCGTTS